MTVLGHVPKHPPVQRDPGNPFGVKHRPPKPQYDQKAQRGWAVGGVAAALMSRGADRKTALEQALLILSRPGVSIGKDFIRYKGQKYRPGAFATTPLASYVTGATARTANKALIEGDSGYQQQLAQLEFDRATQQSTVDDQRRRALLDFGDGSFVQNDPTLAAQAAANPVSISRLLAAQHSTNLLATRNQANRYGTTYGGGLQAGLAGEQNRYSGVQTDATRSLTDLLSGLNRQQATLGQGVAMGKANALQDATNRLLSAGVLHANTPPHLPPRRLSFFNPYAKPGSRITRGY
jgi:hypothetical protein